MPTTKKEMLDLVLTAAKRAGVPAAIGGGIAVAAHGYRRETADVDAFFLATDRTKLLRSLQEISPENFVLDKVSPSHWIVLPEGNPPDERIDLIFATGDPEKSAVEMAVTKKYQGSEIPVFPIDLLVTSKFLVGREDPKDALDAYSLLKRGAYVVADVTSRLVQMGLSNKADKFIELMKYLEDLPRRQKR